MNRVEKLFKVPEENPAMFAVSNCDFARERTKKGGVESRAAFAAVVPFFHLAKFPSGNKRFADNAPHPVLHRGLGNTPSITIRFRYHCHKGDVPRGPLTSPLSKSKTDNEEKQEVIREGAQQANFPEVRPSSLLAWVGMTRFPI